MTMTSTAVLVDAAFFIRRYSALQPSAGGHSGARLAESLHALACRHAVSAIPEASEDDPENDEDSGQPPAALYRLFVYDCPPFDGGLHHPISKQWVDFKKTPMFFRRTQFHEKLRQLRKVALRLGQLSDTKRWIIKPEVQAALLKGHRDMASLVEKDVLLDVKPQGVEVALGHDIAALALKKQVQRIVLMTGSTHFVSAADLARQEGIEFLLDTLHAPVASEVYAHIDGVVSTAPKPSDAKTLGASAPDLASPFPNSYSWQMRP
jgi:uncharacterized LabA/DUF88 family protein